MKILALVAGLLSAAAAGCTSVHTDTVETGLWENNPEKMHEACKLLRKLKLQGEVITKENLKHLGFNLDAPNVVVVSGVLALKRTFGDRVFQDEHGGEGPVADLEEYEKYTGYSVPYRRVETTSDRMYLSEVEVFQVGVQLQAFLLLKEGKLCYLEMYESHVDTYYSHYALMEGLITAIRAPGKAALNLLIKMEEYQHPGLTYFIPIPID